MNKNLKNLKKKFKKFNIDGYIFPKNDDYFTEYSKINRLKIISNFSGSAGLAIILKKKNYLFTDGRYTIQSHLESGKNFKIISYEKIINCNLFKNLTLGIDPKLFTYSQIKKYFLKNNKIKFIDQNLIDPKSFLQEWTLKKYKKLPEYKTLSKEGPDHEPIFEIELKFMNYKKAFSKAISIKEAEKYFREQFGRIYATLLGSNPSTFIDVSIASHLVRTASL